MKNNSFDSIENLAVQQYQSAAKMRDCILHNLSEGKIDEGFAFELLGEVRDIIKNTYNQRIEMYMSIGENIDRLDSRKIEELQSLDRDVYEAADKARNKELDVETKETIDSLFR